MSAPSAPHPFRQLQQQPRLASPFSLFPRGRGVEAALLPFNQETWVRFLPASRPFFAHLGTPREGYETLKDLRTVMLLHSQRGLPKTERKPSESTENDLWFRRLIFWSEELTTP